MQISKQSMFFRIHRFRKWNVGKQDLNDSMQLDLEQSSMIPEVFFIKLLVHYVFQLQVFATNRKKHFYFISLHYLF